MGATAALLWIAGGAAALTNGFADGLDIRFSDKSAAMLGAGKGDTQARMASADLRIGELMLSNLRVVVLANDPFKLIGRKVDGVLGYDVFAKWTVTIDFAKKTLAFFEPSILACFRWLEHPNRHLQANPSCNGGDPAH
jgi:hypothetical protein